MFDLRLPLRPPLDWMHLMRWSCARAIPGIETAGPDVVERTVRLGGRAGTISVRREDARALSARVSLPASTRDEVTRRLEAMFDLHADVAAIRRVLSRSTVLAPLLGRHPGIRIPGCWEPFEILVRAIVGQQVSVAAARTILGRIVARTGDGNRPLFPTAERLAGIDVRGLGMPDRRADTLRVVARAVAGGEIDLGDPLSARQALLAIPGIGPWTVEYVAMRAFRDRDAFPHGDLVLRRVAGQGTVLDARELLAMAEPWRPFRAYAALLLWSAASDT